MAEAQDPPEGRDAQDDPAQADERLVQWAQAVADRRSVDWEQLGSKAPDLAASISALRLVETVIAAHQSPDPAGAGPAGEGPKAPPAEPAFSPLPADAAWGPLRLLEKIGEGEFGEVFRAFDPALQTEVAVKILRRPSKDEVVTERFFDEARRLARVHHPNVLRVYGAAIHDGRVGIWSELVRGRTLESAILVDGPFGPREAAVVGIDLCGAVAAVHRAGLLHRDLKTRNVMREQGGRIVLMDFGSVSELAGGDPLRGAGYGTPVTVAPELLRGEPATRATDIYALGVLLYRLVTGHYPVEARSLVELIDMHHRGEWTPLREARPDLPREFVEVVERAIDPEPKRRFSGPAALERALRATWNTADADAGESGARAGRVPGWLRPVGIALAALLAVLVARFAPDIIKLVRPQEAGRPPSGVVAPEGSAATQGGVEPGGAVAPGGVAAPAVDLTASARLYREQRGHGEPLSDGAAVSPGDALYLEIESPEPAHIYVLDEDAAGHVFVLFPLAEFEPGNPLPAGVRNRLPGLRKGRIENWTVTAAGGSEDVVVIASRAPFSELEGELERMPHATPGAPVAYGALSPQSLSRLRGIGGTAPPPPTTDSNPPRLSEILRGIAAGSGRPHDIWVWETRLTSR